MLASNKRILKIIMLIFIILAFYYQTAKAVVEPTNMFYVNDYANVLSSETKEYIMNTCVELQNKTGAQIVVVTVDSLDGESLEEYATELFRKFGIGDTEKNNGVLMLCSTGDRRFRIEVGYGLEGALPDGKTGRIQDEYIIPYLRNDNYDEGIRNGFSAILQEVCSEYNIEIEGIKTPQEVEDRNNIVFGVSIFIAFILATIIRISTSFVDIKKSIIIKMVYTLVFAVVLFIITKIISIAMQSIIFNIIFLLGLRGGYGGFYGGGSSGGGGFSGGRRLFWRRRKLKKFLKYKNTS